MSHIGLQITVRNDTADIVGAHFVSYEGEEDDGCVLWLRPGQKKTVEWALGWVIRFRSHATKALLLELCVSEQR